MKERTMEREQKFRELVIKEMQIVLTLVETRERRKYVGVADPFLVVVPSIGFPISSLILAYLQGCIVSSQPIRWSTTTAGSED